jgi:hypothetical protein
MRTSLGVLAACALLGACTSSGGDPSMCHTVQCNPPTCCGASCSSSADCCDETVCSASGRCIPARCVGCGELGCRVDFDACTAECAAPASCGELCGSDADCATGTSCRASVTGELRCYPDACTSCDGLTPLCRIDDACGVSCVAPERCGEECAPGSDCGPSAVCHAFPSGVSRCVPLDFEGACSFCGSLGCSFWPSTCDVTCQDPAQPDAGPPLPGRDAGPPLPGRDAGAPPIGSDDAGAVAPPTPSCAACCAPCTRDEDCCPGSSCGTRGDTGAQVCVPTECTFCAYGCTFQCP